MVLVASSARSASALAAMTTTAAVIGHLVVDHSGQLT